MSSRSFFEIDYSVLFSLSYWNLGFCHCGFGRNDVCVSLYTNLILDMDRTIRIETNGMNRMPLIVCLFRSCNASYNADRQRGLVDWLTHMFQNPLPPKAKKPQQNKTKQHQSDKLTITEVWGEAWLNPPKNKQTNKTKHYTLVISQTHTH